MSVVETTTGFIARVDSDAQWTLAGELDFDSAPQLVGFARSAPTPCAGLLVRVNDLTFMDAAGWRALCEAHVIIGPHRSMRLIGATRAVARVVSILGTP